MKRKATPRDVECAQITLEVFKDIEAALQVSLDRRCDGMTELELDKTVSHAVTMLGHWTFVDVEDLIDLLRNLDDYRDMMGAKQ